MAQKSIGYIDRKEKVETISIFMQCFCTVIEWLFLWFLNLTLMCARQRWYTLIVSRIQSSLELVRVARIGRIVIEMSKLGRER